MMDNAKGLQDHFSNPLKSPAMAMLRPKMCLVGSIPEGTRAGGIQEIDIMMEMAGFQHCYLSPTESASSLKLTTIGKMYFGKILVFDSEILIIFVFKKNIFFSSPPGNES